MIDIEIDKLTNSVEEVATGQSHNTQITRASEQAIRRLKNWKFDWLAEMKQSEVWQLVAPSVGTRIQGLISFQEEAGYVHVVLIESHPKNVGRNKQLAGVAGNLMAFAAKKSQELGNEGYVAFDAKHALICHYEKSLGAQRVGSSQRMVIRPEAAQLLISRYFGGNDGTL